MPFGIYYTEDAKKALGKVDKKVAKRIKAKLAMASVNPDPFIKRLKGIELYAMRVGDYRIILDIKRNELIILVIKIGHRRSVYETL